MEREVVRLGRRERWSRGGNRARFWEHNRERIQKDQVEGHLAFWHPEVFKGRACCHAMQIGEGRPDEHCRRRLFKVDRS